MVQTLVRLNGVQELILEKVVHLGIHKTKSEAIRDAINELGKEYNVFKNAKELEDELAARKMLQIDNEIMAGKRKVYSEAEARKKYKVK